MPPKEEPAGEDFAKQALGFASKLKRGKVEEPAAPVVAKRKAHGRKAAKVARAKGDVVPYAEYAPGRFKRHFFARALNVGADNLWPPVDAQKADSAKAVEMGEAVTAAGYYVFGLPPYDASTQGDGHPVWVAVERTGRFAGPKLKVSPTFSMLLDALKQRFRRKRGGQQDPLVRP